MQTFRAKCDIKSLSGIEITINNALQVNDRAKALQNATKLNTAIDTCTKSYLYENNLSTPGFLKVIDLMHARILLLKGFIAISKGIAP